MAYYLRINLETLDDAARYPTRAAAVAAFREVAENLDGRHEPPEGSIHIAPRRAQLTEYPDYLLSAGPRGGVRCEKA